MKIDRRSLPENEVADKPAGGRRLGQAEMAVAEGIEHVRRRLRDRPMTGSESGSDGRKPIHSRPPDGSSPGRKRCAFSSIAFERAKLGGRLSPPSSTAPPTRRPVSSGVMTKPWPEKISCRFTSKAAFGSVVL